MKEESNDSFDRESDETLSIHPDMENLTNQVDEWGHSTYQLSASSEKINEAVNSLLKGLGDRKYRVRGVVGKGGMGVVYKAKDLHFLRTVAMKVLMRGKKYREEDLQRFIEEAQITSQLEHPNIVPIHEMANDEKGNVYYTMKYVDGLTLTDVLKNIRKGLTQYIEQYPLSRLLNIFQKTCDAVAFAHSRGVMHQDLKPSNIMIGDYGEVLVLDWGLARVIDHEQYSKYKERVATDQMTERVIPERTVQYEKVEVEVPREFLHTDHVESELRTEGGSIIGTPGFMAPEQIQSHGIYTQVDQRSDIYSLGAILYSILTLHPPVMGHDIRRILNKIIEGDIALPESYNHPEGKALSEDRAEWKLPHCTQSRIPVALSEIAMKALSNNPNHRYQSVKEMQQDIEAYQNGLIWNVVLEDDFSDADLLSRWEVYGGRWDIADEELRLCAGDPQILLLKEPLAGDVRIEFECRQESAYLTDMACVIAGVKTENWKEIPSSGYLFKFGGYSNSMNVLERSGNKFWSMPASPLVRGKWYRVRIERIGSTLKMMVNGREIINVVDKDPLSGTDRCAIGLVGSMTDSRYSHVKISRLGVPRKADVLEIAEKHLQKGHFITATDLFQDIIDSSPEPDRIDRAEKGIEIARKRRHLVKDLPAWKDELQRVWPNARIALRMDNDGVTVDLSHTGIRDLEPLRGMPITTLICDANAVQNLDPLSGMPLKMLNCAGNPIESLEPLRDMALNTLICEGCPVESLEPLRGMPLNMINCGGGCLSSGLEPLRGMPLTWLACWGADVASLEPLRGMALTALYCDGNHIEDLDPLRGMPLGRLICSGNFIASLEPISVAPLTTLHCGENRIRDLGPVSALDLNILTCHCNLIESIGPLADLSLNSLNCGGNLLTSIDFLAKRPPDTFLFDCDTISTQELEWLHRSWSRDFRFSLQSRHAEVLLALRHRDVDRLKQLATDYKGRKFLYIPKSMRWEDAHYFCEGLGGHLAVIPDEETNSFVVSMMPEGSWFWVGLRTDASGKHRWVTGDRFEYGRFSDCIRERKPGEKLFCDGVFSSENFSDAHNPFMIEWE